MGSFMSSAPKGSSSSSSAATFVNAFPLVLIFLVFYFFLFRPQQKQERERRSMVDNLKVGDRVLTQGGVYGVISAFKGQSVMLKVADGVKLEIARAAVTQVFTESSNGSELVTSGDRQS